MQKTETDREKQLAELRRLREEMRQVIASRQDDTNQEEIEFLVKRL